VIFVKQGPGQNKLFNILVSGNKIPDWFNYRKEVSNSTSCEIDIDVPTDLDGEITRIAFSTVFEAESINGRMIDVYVISGGVEIYCGREAFSLGGSTYVWLGFHVPKMAYNGHLRVKFVYSRLKSSMCPELFEMKSCGVHLVHRYEEMVIDGIQVIKGPCDNDDNDDGPQQKKQSSNLGIRISDPEAEKF
jgi:hypothetical protein